MRKCITNHFNIFAFIILALVVFGLYGKSITYDWQYLDDDVLILEKQDYLKLSNIKTMFTDTFFGVPGDTGYRPLLNVSFAIDSTFSGLNPTAYHISNILIFLFAVFSIYLLFSYKNNKVWSLFFSLIIAVNPLLCAVVCRPVDRSDSLLTLFSVLSFYFLIKFLESQQKCTMYNVQCTINDKQQSVIPECSNREFAVSSSDHPTIRLSDHQSSRRCRSCSYSASQLLSFSAHILFFSMALFTKETALVLPIIFILFLFLRRSSVPQSVIPECSNRESMLNKTPLSPSLRADEVGVAIQRRCRSSASQLLSFSAIVLLYIIIVAFFLFLRHIAVGTSSQPSTILFYIISILNNSTALIKYFYNLLFPITDKLPSFSDIGLFLITLLIFSLIFVKTKYKNIKLLIFALSSFILFLLPTMVMSNHMHSYFQNRIFLPMICIYYVLLNCLQKYKISTNRVIIFCLIFVLCIYTNITFFKMDRYQNRWTAFTGELIDTPNSPYINAKFGMLLAEVGMYEQAEEKLQKAISLEPYNYVHYENLALIYYRAGDVEKAKYFADYAQKLKNYENFY